MAIIPYWFRLHHGTGVSVRMLMNDVLFYRHPGTDNFTISGSANHLLVPGENTLTIEVLPGTPPPAAPALRGPAELKIMVHNAEDTLVATARWEWWNPNEEPPLPAIATGRFRPAGDVAEPAFVRAPRATFGPEGTASQRESVRRVHEAFRARDVPAFLDANALKLAERSRSDADDGHNGVPRMRAKLAEMLQREWDVRPLDMDELSFESQAGGRVAYVTRKDGGKALQATCLTNNPGSTITWETDLWLTQVDSEWQVFR
jgi:hypothetical protein